MSRARSTEGTSLRRRVVLAARVAFATLAVVAGTTPAHADEFVRKHEGDFARPYSIARLPDLDGDRVPEYAIGLASAAGGGQVTVRSGASGEVRFVAEGTGVPELNGESFGHSVAATGDLDGDRVPDLVAGAPRGARNGSPPGYVRAFSGENGATLWQVDGGSPHELFGTSVAGIGDVDGDGTDDVAVGAPGVTGVGAGFVRIFSGKDGSEIRTLTPDGPFVPYNLGRGVVGIGDVDGDGRPDLAVAAGGDRKNGKLGEVWTYSVAKGVRLKRIAGSATRPLDPSNLVAIGDLNGDGRVEFAIGGDKGGVLYDGRGRRIALLAAPFVGAADDVDADGRPDLLLVTPETATLAVVSSAAAVARRRTTVATWTADDDFLSFGAASFAIGDVDGDHLVEAVILSRARNESGVVRFPDTDYPKRLVLRVALQRPEDHLDDLATRGTAELRLTGDVQALKLTLSRLPAGDSREFGVFLETGPATGAFDQVGSVTATRRGGGKLVLTGSGAPPAELGISRLSDLEDRRLEVRTADGETVLVLVLTRFGAFPPLNLRISLLAPDGTKGRSTLVLRNTARRGSALLEVRAVGVDPASTVWITDEEGTPRQVGTLSRGRFRRDTGRGEPLPLGAAALTDLLGRTVEVRDGAETVLSARIR